MLRYEIVLIDFIVSFQAKEQRLRQQKQQQSESLISTPRIQMKFNEQSETQNRRPNGIKLTIEPNNNAEKV